MKFWKGIHNTKGILDYIHSDLWGSVRVTSMGGGRKIKKLRNQVELEVEPLEVESQIKDTEAGRQPQEPEFTEDEESMDEYSIARDRLRRVTRLPVRFRLNDIISFAPTVVEDIIDFEPRNYKEAMGNKDSTEWSKAMEEEMNSLKKNQTWMLVHKPKR